jgi:hypothetical protein
MAKLDPPVRGDAVAAKFGALLGLDEPVAPAKLSAEQGEAIETALGL